jgi:hypothetical protein
VEQLDQAYPRRFKFTKLSDAEPVADRIDRWFLSTFRGEQPNDGLALTILKTIFVIPVALTSVAARHAESVVRGKACPHAHEFLGRDGLYICAPGGPPRVSINVEAWNMQAGFVGYRMTAQELSSVPLIHEVNQPLVPAIKGRFLVEVIA